MPIKDYRTDTEALATELSEFKNCGATIFVHGFNNRWYAKCGDYMTDISGHRTMMHCVDCGGEYVTCT